jgi:hypothetical protein
MQNRNARVEDTGSGAYAKWHFRTAAARASRTDDRWRSACAEFQAAASLPAGMQTLNTWWMAL